MAKGIRNVLFLHNALQAGPLTLTMPQSSCSKSRFLVWIPPSGISGQALNLPFKIFICGGNRVAHLVTKSGDLRWMPRTHMVPKEDRLQQVIL